MLRFLLPVWAGIKKVELGQKRLLEMSSVTENNRIIPAADELDN